jgi:hypothetical protein
MTRGEGWHRLEWLVGWEEKAFRYARVGGCDFFDLAQKLILIIKDLGAHKRAKTEIKSQALGMTREVVPQKRDFR